MPANQIDPLPGAQAGFVVARNGSLPSTKLWFFKVTKDDSSGNPVFGSARSLTVPQYDMPPDAAQPLVSQTLSTLRLFAASTGMTQAVMAFNPRTNKNEFWTQHTIASPNNPAFSALRYYEIDPLPSAPFLPPGTLPPVLLNANFIFSTFGGGSFIFNGSISPDRVRFGDTAAFGDSFVLQYNRSGLNDFPEIRAASSVKGAPVGGFLGIIQGGSYTDSICLNADGTPTGNSCRWGDYSGISPDPAPSVLGISEISGSGVIWGTNQFSPGLPPPPPPPALPSPLNMWSTQIFALKP